MTPRTCFAAKWHWIVEKFWLAATLLMAVGFIVVCAAIVGAILYSALAGGVMLILFAARDLELFLADTPSGLRAVQVLAGIAALTALGTILIACVARCAAAVVGTLSQCTRERRCPWHSMADGSGPDR